MIPERFVQSVERAGTPGLTIVVAGYVRRSSHTQASNFSIDAQKRGIREECQRRGLPEPTFFEDDERSARGEQIDKRPAFQRLLAEVEAGRVQMIIVHTLDRWSRNVTVTLQTFRILADKQCAFVSLSEHIDYSTPGGKLQLTMLAAFAAYYSDATSRHIRKGKAERAAQGLFNGDLPFGYRRTGPKLPPEPDPTTFPGLRLMGKLRMQGLEAKRIAEALNAAGYRTGSKRYGQRLFTKDTVSLMLRNEFYAAFTPGDDRGTVLYHGQRYRGQHPAVFTTDEWRKIREGTLLNYDAPLRAERARRFYAFSGYIADIRCRLLLHGQGDNERKYYKDVAKKRKLPCPAGGFLQVSTELVHRQFGALLAGLHLPDSWRENVRQQGIAVMEQADIDRPSVARERERLQLKLNRILKQHREGYIEDEEMQAELAAVVVAQSRLNPPTPDGLSLDAMIEAGERLPGIAALWEVATPEEQRELVTLLLEAGGLYYDLERKMIAAIKPRSSWLPVLRLIQGLEESQDVAGMLVIADWQQQERC
jgi:DNA invertase Pin-like site-specific DNA recombinase